MLLVLKHKTLCRESWCIAAMNEARKRQHTEGTCPVVFPLPACCPFCASFIMLKHMSKQLHRLEHQMQLSQLLNQHDSATCALYEAPLLSYSTNGALAPSHRSSVFSECASTSAKTLQQYWAVKTGFLAKFISTLVWLNTCFCMPCQVCSSGSSRLKDDVLPFH